MKISKLLREEWWGTDAADPWDHSDSIGSNKVIMKDGTITFSDVGRGENRIIYHTVEVTMGRAPETTYRDKRWLMGRNKK